MIRKLSVHDLLPGMYVVDLHKSWLEHLVWRRRFKVDSLDHVRKLIDAGIEEVSIDTAQGIDLPPPPVAGIQDIARRIARHSVVRKPPVATVSLGEERRRAGRLLQQGVQLLDALTLAARNGRAVEAACLEPVISKMMESVARNPDALVPLAACRT